MNNLKMLELNEQLYVGKIWINKTEKKKKTKYLEDGADA